jgi:3-dehydro-L-gulonate-6-phosphate decarboxylase
VAGGIGMDLIPYFDGLDIKVFIIGRAIREAADPPAAARKFRQLINELS